MRFQTYMTESSGVTAIEEAWDEILPDIQPYLKELRKYDNDRLAVRGMKVVKMQPFKEAVRKDRKPRDTPIQIHDATNKYFGKKYGFKARSQGMFAKGGEPNGGGDVSEYGYRYAVFPIGKYKYLWSPDVEDLINEIDAQWAISVMFTEPEYQKDTLEIMGVKKMSFNDRSKIRDDLMKGKMTKKLVPQLEKVIKDRLNDFMYTKENLHQALEYEHEIMFDCKKYWAIPCEDFKSYRRLWELVFNT